MGPQVVVLGAGVGGTLTANLLAQEIGDRAHIKLIDPTGNHVYQPGFLYLALGQAKAKNLSLNEDRLLRDEIEVIRHGAEAIDIDGCKVRLTDGTDLPYDYLVIATGSRVVPEEVPGFEGAQHFYTMEGAEHLYRTLQDFDGGRVLIGVAGIPYKCPPAPVEFTFMIEAYLKQRGLRQRSSVTLLSPLNRAFTIESASKVVQPIMEERGIELETFFNVETVDPDKRVVNSLEGDSREFDLLVLVPPHRGQQIVDTSGIGDAGGWIPTDQHTLQLLRDGKPLDNVYVIGDATDIAISKSGSTAHFQSHVVAERISSAVKAVESADGHYNGRVMCFLETGHGKATVLQFDYDHPPTPPQPSRHWHMGKWMFNRMYWVTVPQGRVPV
jgi:sulfide:quinone oxidoreductase